MRLNSENAKIKNISWKRSGLKIPISVKQFRKDYGKKRFRATIAVGNCPDGYLYELLEDVYGGKVKVEKYKKMEFGNKTMLGLVEYIDIDRKEIPSEWLLVREESDNLVEK